MVQINLLPATKKKKYRKRIELQIKVGPIIFVLVGIMLAIILIWALLGVRLGAAKRDLSKVDEELRSLKFTLEKLTKLKADKKELTGKLEFMDQHLERKVLWARNLNQLSNLVPQGIWLKKVALSIEKGEQLSRYDKIEIEGSAVSLQAEEMINLIGGFMSALKKDEFFSEQFSEIQLISSQTKKGKGGKIEIMDFKLFCQFK